LLALVDADGVVAWHVFHQICVDRARDYHRRNLKSEP
jgi:hypothetical protein